MRRTSVPAYHDLTALRARVPQGVDAYWVCTTNLALPLFLLRDPEGHFLVQQHHQIDPPLPNLRGVLLGLSFTLVGSPQQTLTLVGRDGTTYGVWDDGEIRG